ncbi:P-loop NTPase family protein [Maricaulis sp. CAU 1757]
MNLTQELHHLIDGLEPIARPGGQGRALMVMGASPGAGASTVARELARLAAQRSRRGVWLYDLDLPGNAQAKAARVTGPAYDASFGRPPFWSLKTTGKPARIVARQSVVRNLFVTELQASTQSVREAGLHAAPDYWDAVRQSIDLAIVDAPGQSKAVMPLVTDLDGVILVADARLQRTDGLAARRAAIEARGGVVAGVIVNRAGGMRSAA